MYCQSLLVALLGLGIISSASALTPPNASERTQCEFEDHTNVTIEYGSIGINGRKIFGGLVPYGKAWETGYKRSTTFVTNVNLVVGGKEVMAGRYILSTLPNPGAWTMVLKKVIGKDSPGPVGEVAGIDLLVRPLPSPLERFTISFDQHRGGCVLNLRWEQTEASVLVAEKK